VSVMATLSYPLDAAASARATGESTPSSKLNQLCVLSETNPTARVGFARTVVSVPEVGNGCNPKGGTLCGVPGDQ